MSNYELMMAFNRGWGDGAGGRVKKPNQTFGGAYENGYDTGRKARRAAFDECAKRFLITPREIQTSVLVEDLC